MALVGCGDAQEPEAPVVAQPVAPPAAAAAQPRGTPVSPDGPSSAKSVAPEREATLREARRGGVLVAADRASFRRLQESLGGRHGLAVAGLGRGVPVKQLGTLRTGVAWSTGKVPIAMAVMASGAGAEQRDALAAAITASDNEAAERLWELLGGGRAAAAATEAQVREAGDRTTSIEHRKLLTDFSSFGQTEWSLRDQTRFVAGMACTTAGPAVLGLMGQVEPSQRWGLGDAGVQAEFKGGWGPGIEPGVNAGYFDRQMGVLTVRGKPMAVAIASAPSDGSHETGTQHLTAIARWIVQHADVSGLPSTPDC